MLNGNPDLKKDRKENCGQEDATRQALVEQANV
jgi:hypothetical protein